MLFALKRGRPKTRVDRSQVQEISRQNLEKSAHSDVLQSLFLLKRITREQNDGAKFYLKLRSQFHRSIESPNMSAGGSMVEIRDSNCRTYNHCTKRDEEIFSIWNEIKLELNKVDKGCKDLIDKVVIENNQRIKDELLNPTNMAFNYMRILQMGLDQINKYKIQLESRFRV